MDNVIYLKSFGTLKDKSRVLITVNVLMNFDDILDIYHVCIILHNMRVKEQVESKELEPLEFNDTFCEGSLMLQFKEEINIVA